MLTRVRRDVADPDHEITDQTQLLRQAQLLEQAHEVLVQALATVDKI